LVLQIPAIPQGNPPLPLRLEILSNFSTCSVVNEDTPFRIGSITKAITTLMLFKLRDARKVVLDSPVKVKRAIQCLLLILNATFPIPRIMFLSSLFGHHTRTLKESHGGVWHHRTVAFKDQVRKYLVKSSCSLTLFYFSSLQLF